MIYNGKEEIWFELNNNSPQGRTVKAISNRGRLKRQNGVIEEITYKTMACHNGEHLFCHRLLLEHFKPQTLEDKLLGRYYTDHITHHPVGMLLNDIKNLRWCTVAENNNFYEHRNNVSISHKGKTPANKGVPMSEEQKKKMSLAKKGRHWRIENGVRVWYD